MLKYLGDLKSSIARSRFSQILTSASKTEKITEK